MTSLPDSIPDVETLLELQPEELAGAILLDLATNRRRVDPYSFIQLLFQSHPERYPRERKGKVEQAILEAWNWLVRESLLVEEHNPSGPRVFFVTRRGQTIADPDDFAAYRKASLFPKHLLHPTIAKKCWLAFLRGEYDTAVFQAFKEVEIAVREAGGYSDSDYGVSMMRKAFAVDDGPLTDGSSERSERQSLSDLYAGAIGSYKNPHSHRTVTINEPTDAIEMIMLANHLLRIVEARRSGWNKCGQP